MLRLMTALAAVLLSFLLAACAGGEDGQVVNGSESPGRQDGPVVTVYRPPS